MDPSRGEQAAQVFEEHRTRLNGLAYRLLGRTGEAEEVVQDAFLRWASVDREDVRDVQAFLIKTVTRLALDRLKSAQARREEYVGPWLPEPLMTQDPTATIALGPLEALEQRDLVSIGLLLLLERLSAAERGVFVLREAFDLSYQEIATILGLEAANCRQIYARAQKHLFTDRSRFAPSREQHVRLLTEFQQAIAQGDLDGLRSLLSDDVTLYNDGGGRVRAARKLVYGADRVARFFMGLSHKFAEPFGQMQMVEINGLPAFMVFVNGDLHVTSIEVESGRIRRFYDVVNPDKLAYLRRQLAQKGNGSA